MTEGGDIGFRVYYKSSDKDTDDLVPLSRIEVTWSWKKANSFKVKFNIFIIICLKDQTLIRFYTFLSRRGDVWQHF